MDTNCVSTNGEADLTECNGEKVVTMMDVLQEQQDFEDDANAVLGASDEKNCTFEKGYVKRQAIYACLTCCSEAKFDETKRAGVCLACSLSCHENHDLVELYTKRHFRCDCGNPKFNSTCQFTPSKNILNEENKYNQNFSGIYCVCHRPYPDPEAAEEDEMIQCIVCEDWLHYAHLESTPPPAEQYSEMICKNCLDKNVFLHDYSNIAVNVEYDEITVDNPEPSIVNVTSVANDTDMFNDIADSNSEGVTSTLVDTNLKDATNSLEKTKDENITTNEDQDHDMTKTDKNDEELCSKSADISDKEVEPSAGVLDTPTEPTITEDDNFKSQTNVEEKSDDKSLNADINETTNSIETCKESEFKDSKLESSEVTLDLKDIEVAAADPAQKQEVDIETTEQITEKNAEATCDTNMTEGDINPPAENNDLESTKTETINDKSSNSESSKTKITSEELLNVDAPKDANEEIKNVDHDKKRKLEDTDIVMVPKKTKLDESHEASGCIRPRLGKKTFKGASFWPSNFRQKLCTCNECMTMYKDLSVLYLLDPEDTVSAYEVLGQEKTNGSPATQYEKGLEALSSLDRVQQINALTEYNNMRDKLLDFLKSFKDRKEIVKEEDIKAFFAGMKPKREPDGVYFCR